MPMPRGSARYTEAEVRALIVEYAAVKESADTTRPGLRALVELADLHRALEVIPLEYWEVVLLHGLLGLSQQQTACYLNVSQQAVSKRYRLGLEETHYLMNGGT